MPSVTLVSPFDGAEVSVDSRLDYVQLVYGKGYRPKTGGTQENYLFLAGRGPAPQFGFDFATQGFVTDQLAALRDSVGTPDVVPGSVVRRDNAGGASLATMLLELAQGAAPGAATRRDWVEEQLAALGADIPEQLLAGAALRVFGHSYTPVPGFYITAGHEWSTLLANRRGMRRVSSGVSGSRLIEQASIAIGTTVPTVVNEDRSWRAGDAGIVVVECEMNDAIFGPATVAGRNGYRNALRALLATVTASSRIEAETATSSGAWATFTDPRTSGGSLQYTTAYSASKTFTNVSAPTGKVYLLTLANRAVASNTGTIGIAVDGVDQQIAYVGAGQMDTFVSATASAAQWPDYSPAVIAIDVPPGGKHTIAVVKMDNTTLPIYVDALLPAAPAAPSVIVCQDPPIGPYAVQSLQDAWAANSPALHQIITDVAAEFPTARVVDLGPGWNPATMVGAADLNHFHPGDLGMEHIADLLEPVMVDSLVQALGRRIWGA